MRRYLVSIRHDALSCTLVLVAVFTLFHLHLFTPGHRPSRVSRFFEELEYQTFDYRMRARIWLRPPPVSDRVVLLVINDDSLKYFGRWPWPRRYFVDLTRTLASLGVRAIMFDIEFPEPSERTLAARATGETIEKTIEHARDVVGQLLDPATFVETFRDRLAQGPRGWTELADAIRMQAIPAVTRIGEVLAELSYQPDELLASAFEEARRRGTDVYGVFFFEGVPTLEAVHGVTLASRAFEALRPNPDAALKEPDLVRALGPDGLLQVVRRARAYRTIEGHFDAALSEVVGHVGEGSQDEIDWAKKHLLRERLEEGLEATPEASDEALIGRAMSSLKVARPDLESGLARKILMEARASRTIMRRDSLEVVGGQALPLEEMFQLTPPVPAITEAYSGLASSTVLHDSDGVLRRVPLLSPYRGRFLGQAVMPIVLKELGVKRERLRVEGERLVLPGARLADGRTVDLAVPLDSQGQCLVNWESPVPEGGRIPIIAVGDAMLLVRIELERDEHLARQGQVRIYDRLMRRAAELARKDPTARVTLEAISGTREDPPRAMPAGAWETHFRRQIEEEGRAYFGSLRRRVEGMGRVLARPELKPDDRQRLLALAAEPRALLERFEEEPRRLRERLKKLMEGKIVVIGATAVAATDFAPSPLSEKYPKVGVHANLLNMMLTGSFIERAHPLRVGLPLWVAVALVGALVLSPLGFMNALWGFVVLAILLIGGATALLVLGGVWIDVVGPQLVLAGSYIWMASRKYVLQERQKNVIYHTFQTLVDPKVVKVLVADPHLMNDLGGTERQITAFFSDLEGFTTLSEMLTPEQTSQMLTAYLSPMTDVILRHEGVRDKYIGDAIVAMFGAPVPYDLHGASACLAALEQQAYLSDLRVRWAADGVPWYVAIRAKGLELRTRIGLNSGPAKVGLFGSTTAKSFTMIGDTVNLASRLEGANKFFHTFIMISESTFAGAKDLVEARELGRLQVKGKLEPVTVYEPLGPRGQLSAQRAEVLERFQKALSLCREGRFAEAVAGFEAVLAIDPKDGPSRTYIELCRDEEFVAQAGAPWDGVIALKEK